jgi:predicted dehydrogenase
LQKHADVQLVAVGPTRRRNCGSMAKDAYGVQTWSSGEEMIAAGGLDVVFVCAPTYLHAPLVIQALRAGCHVFGEKPMALNETLCADMSAVADECGKVLMIGQVLRFWPEYRLS